MEKKKKKVRSAWISFVGRVVAQVIGAVASVALGLAVLDRYDSSTKASAADAAPAPAAVTAPSPATPRDPSKAAIVVLPLQNYSADAGQLFLANALTEALVTELAHLKGLSVASRTSSMAYRDAAKPLREIARELDVDLVLEGSITAAADRVRITAQLIDARADRHLWAATYDRDGRDVLAIQSAVTAAIARDVDSALASLTRD